MAGIAYKGSMIDARSCPLPGGGFGAKLIITFADGSMRIGVLPGQWVSPGEAEHAAMLHGHRAVDAIEGQAAEP